MPTIPGRIGGRICDLKNGITQLLRVQGLTGK